MEDCVNKLIRDTQTHTTNLSLQSKHAPIAPVPYAYLLLNWHVFKKTCNPDTLCFSFCLVHKHTQYKYIQILYEYP